MQRKHIFIITIILFTLLWPALLLAQTATTVLVDAVETVEAGDHMRLRIFFTVAGAGGLAETAVSEAAVLLEDGSYYPARLEKPPYYMILVLDASGSMAPVFEEVQQAATDFINAAPPEVHFAVIKFDDTIDLLQPYTNDHDQVINAINRIQLKDGGTCLHDVTYTAVQSLEQISATPNRALIIFTDGQDQIQHGANETCSQYTNEETLAFTTNRKNLPIHAVGIAEQESAINQETLAQLATATGGMYISGNEEDFSGQLQEILGGIDQHWLAEADVLPAPGIQRGGLLLTLEDGSLPVPGPFILHSSVDYRQPEEPPEEAAIHISNFRYDELADSFIFDTSLLNLDEVNHLLVEALDQESNIQAAMTLVQNPFVLQQVHLAAENMVAGHRYVAEVMARDLNGHLLTNEDGIPLSDTYEFKYDPPQPFTLTIDSIIIKDEPARFNFESFRLEDDEVMLVVEYHTSGEGEAVQLNGRLLNQITNQPTAQFNLERIEPGVSQAPIESEKGSYTLVVKALDGSGDILTTASHSFTFVSPDNAVMRIPKAFQSNPLLLLLFALTGVAIGFLAWRLGHNLGYRTAHKNLPAGLNLTAQSQEEEAVAETVSQLAMLILDSSPDQSLTKINRWEIDHFPFTIGRDECDISITGDRHVSRNHAQITRENNDYFIKDLVSSNGTFVNDTQLTAQEPMPLRTDKDTRIQIGKTTSFIFNVETEDNKTETSVENK